MRPKPKSPEGTLPEIRPNLHLRQEIKPHGTHHLGQNDTPVTKYQGVLGAFRGFARIGQGLKWFLAKD